MGHARGAAAVRLAKQEPEPEVAIAQVCVSCGLFVVATATPYLLDMSVIIKFQINTSTHAL